MFYDTGPWTAIAQSSKSNTFANIRALKHLVNLHKSSNGQISIKTRFEHILAPLEEDRCRECCWRHDIQHNDIQQNDIHHNDIQHNDIQHNDTQHKGLYVPLGISDSRHNDSQHNDTHHNDSNK